MPFKTEIPEENTISDKSKFMSLTQMLSQVIGSMLTICYI